MHQFELYQGDCLVTLKTMADNSVDSIVTDPPYGLSQGKTTEKSVNECIRRSFNIMLPQFDDGNTKSVQYSDFSAVCGSGSELGNTEVVPIIKSFVGVPECSINLDHNIEGWKEKIYTSTKTTIASSDGMLVDEINSEGSKFIGNYIFDFGDSVDFSTCDILRGNFGQFSSGFFRVPIGSIFSAFFPDSSGYFLSSDCRNGIFDLVWSNNQSRDIPLASGLIMTSRATEELPMLTFDFTGSSDNFCATIETRQVNNFSDFFCPKLVRTCLAASSLSPKLQPCRVSFVADSADGTDSIYHFHLYIPKNLLSNIKHIYTSKTGFMGKKWDYDVPSQEIWEECFRVLKPGGHLLAFAGTRTQHRMAVRIEDAGFEIRDMIAWIYGSGFPKSMDVSKAIDKSAGAEREVVGHYTVSNDIRGGNLKKGSATPLDRDITLPSTDAARQWQGWGTAMKPALEPITVARKPLSEKTVAANVLLHGTGAINIDASRIENSGRWPANVMHDGSHEVTSLFPNTKSGGSVSGNEPSSVTNGIYGEFNDRVPFTGYQDSGSAARFFYCAKANVTDRNSGGVKNEHPTVKPNDLMRYLCRLVTPPGGIVLDPFNGSGSTGKAAVQEGFRYIGCDLSEEYIEISRKRIEHSIAEMNTPKPLKKSKKTVVPVSDDPW